MLGCNAVCPRCRHEFTCCGPAEACCGRRSLHALSGGGLVVGAGAAPLVAPLCPPRTPPQPSPSAPLAFVLPPPPFLVLGLRSDQLTTAPRPSTDTSDIDRLRHGVRLLKQCGWYHEGLTWQQSQQALKDTAAGTFLIRDSSDQRYLYSLSVQTDQGPTSVRLHYVGGRFRLDSEPYLAPHMPLFDTPIDLIVYYVRCSREAQAQASSDTGSGGGGQVWVDSKGCMFSRILVRRPLYRSDEVPSLKHLARLAVHGALERSPAPRLPLLPPAHHRLDLPPSLADYLAQYPYSM